MSVSLPTQSNMPASSQAANGFDRRHLPYQFTNARPGLGEVERVLAGKTLQELERLAIETSYRANAGKRSAMVSELGISPRGLWNKLKEYGLQ